MGVKVNSIIIVRGATGAFSLVFYDDSSGEPIDLTGLADDDLQLFFLNEDGTILTLDLLDGIALDNTVKSKANVTISAGRTQLLLARDAQTLKGYITLGSQTLPIQRDASYNVRDL